MTPHPETQWLSQYVLGNYGRYDVWPVRGEGAYVWDRDGKKYLDFAGGVAVCPLGHCPPTVVKALAEQASTLIHVSNWYCIDKQAELARLIVEECVEIPGKCFFCNSGAEANEGLIKFARKYGQQTGGRFEIITFTGSFHGRTFGAMTATAQEKIHGGFGPLPPGFVYVPFNDLEALKAAITDKTVAILEEGTKNKLDAQDKRIGDLGLATAQQANFMGAIANQTTNVGYLITLVLFIGGLAAYFTATRHAAKEAKETAKQWMEEHERDLRAQIDALKAEAGSLKTQIAQLVAEATHARTEIDQHTAGVTNHAASAHEKIAQAYQQILSSKHIGDSTSRSQADTSAAQTVREVSAALEEKPEKAFTSEDHFARGLNEYLSDRFDSALVSFDKALERAQAEQIAPERHAQLMFARALALGGIGRKNDEIAVYEEIDRRYGADDQLAVREKVAQALVNNGVTFGQIGRTDDELAVYEEIVQRYGADDHPALREQVAKALVNKGFRLGQIGRNDDALAVYEEIVQRYGSDDEPVLRHVAAKALNCRAFHRLLSAKRVWRHGAERCDLLTLAIEDLDRARLNLVEADLPLVLGNLGYARFLAGEADQALEPTRECLRLGGLESLEAQRTDAQTERIEPQDSEYEALLDQLWRELHPEG